MVNYTQSEDDKNLEHMIGAYRRFTHALEHIEDFDQFQESLRQAVGADAYFANQLLTDSEIQAEGGADYDDRVYQKGKVVLPLRGVADGNFVTSSGRRDSKQFQASDIHLMGSIADFVSVLYAQASKFRKLNERQGILQFLMDQFPLGVVCFNAAGELIAGNEVAWRQLGLDSCSDDIKEHAVFSLLREQVADGSGKHFEVDGRLMFAIRRTFAPKGGESVDAHVIYDLSQRRDRLGESLQREYYKALCVNKSVTVALLRFPDEAGAIYDFIKQNLPSLQITEDLVQPLEAFTCACVFADTSVASVRFMLRTLLRRWTRTSPLVSVFNLEPVSGEKVELPLLDQAVENLRPGEVALLPRLLIYDGYYPIVETLGLILEGIVNVEYVGSEESVLTAIQTRVCDGIILDLDSVEPAFLSSLAHDMGEMDSAFRVFYTSVSRRSEVAAKFCLGNDIHFLHKPFDVGEVIGCVGSQFDFA